MIGPWPACTRAYVGLGVGIAYMGACVGENVRSIVSAGLWLTHTRAYVGSGVGIARIGALIGGSMRRSASAGPWRAYTGACVGLGVGIGSKRRRLGCPDCRIRAIGVRTLLRREREFRSISPSG